MLVMNVGCQVQMLKLKYYELMIMVGQHEAAYLDICRYYRAVFDTPIVQQDHHKQDEVSAFLCELIGGLQSLKNVVLYVLLAPHDNEQWDLLHRIQQLRALERIPDYRSSPPPISIIFISRNSRPSVGTVHDGGVDPVAAGGRGRVRVDLASRHCVVPGHACLRTQ